MYNQPQSNLPRANVAILGHKFSGKSTVLGCILFKLGIISEQLILNIEKELEHNEDESEFSTFAVALEKIRHRWEHNVKNDVKAVNFVA